AQYPGPGRLPATCPHRKQQTMKFRPTERGPRAGNWWNARKTSIRAPRGVEYVQVAFAATDIDAATIRIDEHVVGIAADVRARNQCAVLVREDAELRRSAESDENMSGGLGKRHPERIARRYH